MMLVNIQVELHKDDAQEIRAGRTDKRTAIEASVKDGHFTIIKTIDEGEDSD